MKKIKFLPLYHLSNTIHRDYMQYINELVGRLSAGQLNIVDDYHQFSEDLEALKNAIRGKHGSAITLELLALDKQRLKTLSAIRGRLKNTVAGPVKAEQDAAKVLLFAAKQKGDIRKMEYVGKSDSIRFLCEKLLDEQHLPHCRKLGITHWIKALQAENKLFEKKTNERSTEYAIRRTDTVKDTRERVDAAYHKICARIEASVQLGLNNPQIDEFIVFTNKEIKRIKALQAWRKSMRAGKKRREAERKSQ